MAVGQTATHPAAVASTAVTVTATDVAVAGTSQRPAMATDRGVPTASPAGSERVSSSRHGATRTSADVTGDGDALSAYAAEVRWTTATPDTSAVVATSNVRTRRPCRREFPPETTTMSVSVSTLCRTYQGDAHDPSASEGRSPNHLDRPDYRRVRVNGARRGGRIAVVAALLVTLASTTTHVDAAPTDSAPADGTSSYVPVGPVRVADTRTGDGVARLAADTFRVAIGLAAARLDATAAVVSVTLVGDHGFATAYPSGVPRPATSNVNVTPDAPVVATTTVVRLGADASIDIATAGAVSAVVVDLLGVFVPARSATSGRFVTVTPQRLLDTRTTAATLPAGGGEVTVALPAEVGTDAVAVAVNITSVAQAPAGWITAFAAGSPRPYTSLLHAAGTGRARAAATIVPVSNGGLTVAATFGTDVIVDLVGWFTGSSAAEGSDGLYVALDQPVRRADTRTTGRELYPGRTIEVATTTTASAVTGTLTVTESSAAGFVSTHAAGIGRPLVSTTNTDGAFQTASNFLVTAVSPRGVAVFGSGGTHVVVDQTGWFTGVPTDPSLPISTNDPAGTIAYPASRCDTIADGMTDLSDGPDAMPSRFAVIGTSVLGRPIVAEYWGPRDASRVVLVVGQVHGNECSISRFTRAIRMTPPIDYGIWLIPTLNPDGRAAHTRENANRRDLNRDGFLQAEPETQALMAFTRLVHPDLAVHVHSPNGQIAWFGSGRQVPSEPARSGARLSGPISASIAARTGLSNVGAGARSDLNTWFLWQGQQLVQPGLESLLVELPAVSPFEVITARPRPPHVDVATVDAQVRQILAVLDETFS